MRGGDASRWLDLFGRMPASEESVRGRGGVSTLPSKPLGNDAGDTADDVVTRDCWGCGCEGISYQMVNVFYIVYIQKSQ